MTITYSTFIAEVRKALNDIVGSGVTDDFVTNADSELILAIKTAVEQLLLELDVSRLIVAENTAAAMAQSEEGTVHVVTLPTDFLRFVSVKLSSWIIPLFELTDPMSDKAKMQRSPWSRGSKEKPVCILGQTTTGSVLRLYGGDGTDSLLLSYIPSPTEVQSTPTTTPPTYTGLTCNLQDSCKEAVVWRAASVFLDIRGMRDEAERCHVISTQC